jgi:hypothetical protein
LLSRLQVSGAIREHARTAAQGFDMEARVQHEAIAVY